MSERKSIGGKIAARKSVIKGAAILGAVIGIIAGLYFKDNDSGALETLGWMLGMGVGGAAAGIVIGGIGVITAGTGMVRDAVLVGIIGGTIAGAIMQFLQPEWHKIMGSLLIGAIAGGLGVGFFTAIIGGIIGTIGAVIRVAVGAKSGNIESIITGFILCAAFVNKTHGADDGVIAGVAGALLFWGISAIVQEWMRGD